MLSQIAPLSESSPADFTSMGFFASMNSDVIPNIALLVKYPTTTWKIACENRGVHPCLFTVYFVRCELSSFVKRDYFLIILIDIIFRCFGLNLHFLIELQIGRFTKWMIIKIFLYTRIVNLNGSFNCWPLYTLNHRQLVRNTEFFGKWRSFIE